MVRLDRIGFDLGVRIPEFKTGGLRPRFGEPRVTDVVNFNNGNKFLKPVLTPPKPGLKPIVKPLNLGFPAFDISLPKPDFINPVEDLFNIPLPVKPIVKPIFKPTVKPVVTTSVKSVVKPTLVKPLNPMIKISGKVVDEIGVPIPFATLSWKSVSGVSTGTTTDFNGNFKITPPRTAKVMVSFNGYKKKYYSATNLPTTIKMIEDVSQLEEVDLGTVNKPKSKNTLKYVGIGLGVLALGVVLSSKSSKKKTAKKTNTGLKAVEVTI